MAERKRSQPRSGGSAGCLVWLSLFCVVVLLFLLNLNKIQGTLERTNFTQIMKTQRAIDSSAEKPVSAAPKVNEPSTEAPQISAPAAKGGSTRDGGAVDVGSDTHKKPESPPLSYPEKPSTDAGQTASQKASDAGPAATGKAAGKTAEKPSAKPAPAIPPKTRGATLCFVRIDDDGVIVRQEVKRVVPATDSPLSDALGALLRGPTEEEIRKRLISLIPSGTSLLSVQVRGSTAFLNFNEAFMYNHYGIEGYAGQLKQVVYTATAFSTVQDVQVLIEGERHDYLGGEGVYIGRPLSRNSF